MLARECRIVAADLGGRSLGLRQKKQIVDGHDLRRPARRHQERMRRMHDIDRSRQHFRRRPLVAMPEIIQHADGDAPVDHARTGFILDACRRAVLPGAREEQDLVTVDRRVRTNQLMDVLAHAGSLPQGGPVVDEDAHDGRVQSQATETQKG